MSDELIKVIATLVGAKILGVGVSVGFGVGVNALKQVHAELTTLMDFFDPVGEDFTIVVGPGNDIVFGGFDGQISVVGIAAVI
jgi:hypothetical protein